MKTPTTPAIAARGNGRSGAARFALVCLAALGPLVALPVRLEAQCTLSGSLVSFEPNPPGKARPGTLGSGYNSNLALYQNGGSGPYRLLMQESYGYSVLDLSNPVNPTALTYHDIRYPLGGANSVTHHGDGQSNVQTIAVSPDGQRVALSTVGPAAPFNTVVGLPSGSNGAFTLWGDFAGQAANGTLIQHVGSRYIAYDILPFSARASDITTLPSPFDVKNMASENPGWPGGYLASLAGNYLLYVAGGAVQVIDASNPGPAGSIATSYPRTTITSADFGGRTIAYYSAAVDPNDATKLWVLVELNARAGENSPSYGLLYVTGGLSKVSAGPIWRVPSQTGDLWWPNPGASSALIASNGDLFVLMWAQRASPTLLYQLYSTTVSAWTSAAPGVFDIPTSFYSTFSAGQPMRGFSGATANSIYAYIPTGQSAYVIPMSCVSVNAPAVASMSVADQAGVALNNGATVFLGDRITITPSINPAPASQPLTGFGWNFDFDFHVGSAYDDGGAGTPPRIKARDNGVFGNPPTPPALITVVGPCDPNAGGTPAIGAGCWNSVTTNGAFGGPDFVLQPAAGSTKALTFALEANNKLGSAGAGLFTLNWKIPTARIQTTQIFAGGSLVSASDGHPTGYQWSFGPDAQHLTASCTTSSCAPPPPNNAKGTHAYSLTAKYFVDQAFTATAIGTYTVTDFAPAFTVNGSASGPITVAANQSLNVVNSSQRGAGISATYQYSFCSPRPCADNYVSWGSMVDAAPGGTPSTSATIPIPAIAGNYALKIRVDYTGGGQAFWPDPAGAAYFPVNVETVFVLAVTASVSPASLPVNQQATFTCNATGGVAPYFYEWRSPISFVVGTQQTYQATSSVAGDVQAYCFVSDSQPIPARSNASATVTFTGGPYRFFVLNPCRVLDTRSSAGPLGGPPLQPAGTPDRAFAVTSSCGIPADARAISVNVAATNPSASGNVSIYRGDGQPTGTNTVAFGAGRTRGNNAMLDLAWDGSGTIKVRNTSPGTLDLIVDVNGYFR